MLYVEDGIGDEAAYRGLLTWTNMASKLQLGGRCSYVGSGLEMTQDGSQMDVHILKEKVVSDGWAMIRMGGRDLLSTKIEVDNTQTQTRRLLPGMTIL